MCRRTWLPLISHGKHEVGGRIGFLLSVVECGGYEVIVDVHATWRTGM